jgi:hypothetical protein
MRITIRTGMPSIPLTANDEADEQRELTIAVALLARRLRKRPPTAATLLSTAPVTRRPTRREPTLLVTPRGDRFRPATLPVSCRVARG